MVPATSTLSCGVAVVEVDRSPARPGASNQTYGASGAGDRSHRAQVGQHDRAADVRRASGRPAAPDEPGACSVLGVGAGPPAPVGRHLDGDVVPVPPCATRPALAEPTRSDARPAAPRRSADRGRSTTTAVTATAATATAAPAATQRPRRLAGSRSARLGHDGHRGVHLGPRGRRGSRAPGAPPRGRRGQSSSVRPARSRMAARARWTWERTVAWATPRIAAISAYSRSS